MIVKNEEDSLARCLASVQDAVDEIIIVDTGSTDNTKEIAASFHAKIYNFTWINDFAAARNFSFGQATKDYILWLDADDVLQKSDLEKLISLKKVEPFTYDSVTMNYHLSFDQDGKPTYSLRRNRLVKRENNFRWIGFVHEYLEVGGNIHHSDIAVTHHKEKQYTDRNLQIYLTKRKENHTFSPRDLYYFANELRDNGRYEEAIAEYEQFLATKLGWVEDEINACMKLAECHGRLKDREKQMEALLRTLTYDTPRAEFCCQFGNMFVEKQQWLKAIYWFNLATTLTIPKQQLSPIDYASWTWMPHLQLTLCYDRIGNRKQALEHHQQAIQLNPHHPSIIFNENYFKGITP
ncbi:glycosyltransferase [Paenibacillus yanchengensis]